MKYIAPLILIVLAAFGLVILPAQAQSGDSTPTAEPPAEQTSPTPTPESGQPDIPLVHTIQDGETLFSIAEQYGTTVETLQLLNDIGDPSLIYAGQQLVIPGGGGTAVATVHTIQVGDTLRGLAADYNTSPADIAAANRLINPDLLVAGLPLTVISRTGEAEANPLQGDAYIVESGDTLSTIAAKYRVPVAAFMAANNLDYPVYLYPGQRLRLPGNAPYQFLPAPWGRVALYPLPVTRGQTVAIYVESLWPGQPAGQFTGQSLRFAPHESGYLALVGLDAFLEPGRYELELTGSGARPWSPFSQPVQVEPGSYGTQYITVPDELSPLLDPAVRAAEDALLAGIYTQFSDTARWQGPFQVPVTNTVVTAAYGDARSYNEGPIEIYHTGVDFGGPVGTPIRAPAAGTVVYSDTLDLHGQTLIIDHGLSVMTGYYHLSEIYVGVGDQVTPGQIVAAGGSTGLSSGPHLHWDLRIGGVPVNGLQWTEGDFLQACFTCAGPQIQPQPPP